MGQIRRFGYGKLLQWLIALCLSTLWMPQEAYAQPKPFAPPHLTAEQIRALRDVSKADQFVVEYEKTSDDGATERSGKLKLIFGPDYFVMQTLPDRYTLVDLALKRTFAVDDVRQTFRNYSNFGDVAYRASEFANRVYLEAVSQTAPQSDLQQSVQLPALPKHYERFWVESDLGVTLHKDGYTELKTNRSGSILAALYGPEKVAEISFSDSALPNPIKRSYQAYMQGYVKVHPLLRRDIVSDGRVAGTIRILTVPLSGDDPSWQTFTLKTSKARTGKYPLSPSYSIEDEFNATDTDGSAFEEQVMPVMIEAAELATMGQKPSIEAANQKLESLLQAGRAFDAFLLITDIDGTFPGLLENCQPTPPPIKFCQLVQQIGPLGRNDERLRLWSTGAALDGQQKYDEAVQAWATIDLTGLDHGHVVKRSIANSLTSKYQVERTLNSEQFAQDRKVILDGFISALTANPFNTNGYRDIGNYYAMLYYYPYAWQAYDLGRAVAGSNQPPPLQSISRTEQNLARTFPQFF